MCLLFVFLKYFHLCFYIYFYKMSCSRIQKLLFSEYSDFEDMVLVESPFAETTRDGRGIRQVQIGLTPTKLILATDIIKNASEYPVVFYSSCIDAEIECLELISIFPIELVTLSVFRRRRRKVLKAKFHDGDPNHNCQIVYFELGGSDKRKMFWNLWCERVKFLSPEKKGGSSLTETSVASSTSDSSLCVTKTRICNNKIWQYYGRTPFESVRSKEPGCNSREKELFFGRSSETIKFKKEPISLFTIPQHDEELRTIYRTHRFQKSPSSFSSGQSKGPAISDEVTEHGGVNKCETDLQLATDSCTFKSTDSFYFTHNKKLSPEELDQMCEDSVKLWEKKWENTRGSRHPRRYGIVALPDLFYCFGAYFAPKSEAFSVQVKKNASTLSVQDDSLDGEFEPPVRKIGLSCSCSHESFRPWSVQRADPCSWSSRYVTENPVPFWINDRWWRAKSVRNMYRENEAHMRKIKSGLCKKSSGVKKKRLMNLGKKFFKSAKIIHFPMKNVPTTESEKRPKIDSAVSVWDIDSSTLACQIPPEELSFVQRQTNGKTSGNLTSWLVFSHRVACLVATEILDTSDVKFRARLISRFINAAEKCHLLHNFQSCRSLLNGLQMPAVYRLNRTWSFVRRNHATRYQMFEKLCRLYRDPRLTSYQKSFYKSAQISPYLPSASHILAALVGHILDQPPFCCSSTLLSNGQNMPGLTTLSLMEQYRNSHRTSLPRVMQQIISAFKIYPSDKSINCTDMDGSNFDCQHLFTDFASGDSPVGTLSQAVNTFFQSVDSCEEQCSGIEMAEELLISGQVAARKYDFGENTAAKLFFLKNPYREPDVNYLSSVHLEPD